MTLRERIDAEISAEGRRRYKAAEAEGGGPLAVYNRLRPITRADVIEITLRLTTEHLYHEIDGVSAATLRGELGLPAITIEESVAYRTRPEHGGRQPEDEDIPGTA